MSCRVVIWDGGSRKLLEAGWARRGGAGQAEEVCLSRNLLCGVVLAGWNRAFWDAEATGLISARSRVFDMQLSALTRKFDMQVRSTEYLGTD